MKEDVLNVLTSEMTKDDSANKTSEKVQNVKENIFNFDLHRQPEDYKLLTKTTK